ncbi:MAG: chromosomal replication initiator protein DnaA [Planctomycetes bacterium]|nr:chromosomal replication initiator protein DnaA [Planctomycetota bacterium]
MAKQDTIEILEEILERVKAIDPVNTRKWFDDLQITSFDHGLLQIGCPDQSCAEFLLDHCLPTFTQAAQNITGHLVSVQFIPADQPQKTEILPAAEKAGRFRLHPDYTFNSFVVGPCNRLAHASCIAISQSPGMIYNPLFLYGNVGLGKTHLLHAVCHDARKQNPDISIQFLSCEEFVNGFISAIEKGSLQEFQNQYRTVDVLIIDDVQFLREREQSQEEFFHTFNALYNNRRQIVLTADCAPQDLAALEDRLISRFKWGLVARLDAPSYETRIAIIKKKAHLRGLGLPDGVAELIAEHIKTNIRELEGALTIIYATAQTTNQPITLELARQALGVQDITVSKNVTLSGIIRMVSDHFDVRITDLQSKKRSQSIALPRQVCMYLARSLTRHSLEEIGGHLGGRDHSTVVHACSKIEQLYKSDTDFRNRIDKLSSHVIQSA